MTSLLDSLPARSRRGRPASASTGGDLLHIVKRWWERIWLLTPAMIVAVAINIQVGDKWGSLPVFWLEGNLRVNTAPTLALLAVYAICVVLHRQHADLLLGVLPFAAYVACRIGFGSSQAGWIGAAAGLVVGVLVWLRRRQGSH